jgi:hypothetical protein
MRYSANDSSQQHATCVCRQLQDKPDSFNNSVSDNIMCIHPQQWAIVESQQIFTDGTSSTWMTSIACG